MGVDISKLTAYAKTKAAGTVSSSPSKQVFSIPVDRIHDNPYQPRIEMDEEKLKELADSILERGLISPILVRSAGGGHYVVIAGHRRLEAHRRLGLKTIEAVVDGSAGDADMAAAAIVENLQRENLNPVELSISMKRYIDEFGKSAEELASEIGKSESWIYKILSVASLPEEIVESVGRGDTSDVLSLSKIATLRKRIAKESGEQAADRAAIEAYNIFLKSGREALASYIAENAPGAKEPPALKVSLAKNGAAKLSIPKGIVERLKSGDDSAIDEIVEAIRANMWGDGDG